MRRVRRPERSGQEQRRIVLSMANGNLSKRGLDVLNRASEMKSDFDFCGEDGDLPKEMRRFMGWLGDYLRSELQREAWEEPLVDADEDGVSLCLYSPTWRLPDDDYVAFSFWWPNLLDGESPCVQLCLPAEDVFPPRNELLKRLRPRLRLSGFTDYYDQGDPEPSFPIWKNIRLEEFQGKSGFDLDSFELAIVDGFRRLIEIEPLIEDAFGSLPDTPPLPSERCLKTIAFLDTEYEGSGNASRMTQLAIVNVAYDAEGDAVVGILEECCMNAGQTLDEAKARGALKRADFIVAHNAFGADRPLLARHLPGTEKGEWLCSLQGIDWKGLLGIQSASLETLMGKVGLRYDQDHNACADARDLRRLLAVKHNGRTFLGRLLDSARSGRLT